MLITVTDSIIAIPSLSVVRGIICDAFRLYRTLYVGLTAGCHSAPWSLVQYNYCIGSQSGSETISKYWSLSTMLCSVRNHNILRNYTHVKKNTLKKIIQLCILLSSFPTIVPEFCLLYFFPANTQNRLVLFVLHNLTTGYVFRLPRQQQHLLLFID